MNNFLAFQVNSIAAKRDRWSYLPALLFLLWAIPCAWLLNPTVDEMYSLQTASQGPAYAAKQAISFELQAPAYFVVLSVWTKVLPGLMGARGFSIFCLFLPLLLLPGLSKRYLPTVWPGYLPLLFATNPFVLHLAGDARSYAFLVCLTVGALHFHLAAYQEGRYENRLGLALVAALGLATHYYFGLFLAVLGGSWLLQKKWKHFLRFSVDMIPALGVLAWLAPALQEQYLGHTGYHPAGDSIPLLLWAGKQGEALLLQAHHWERLPGIPWLLRLLVAGWLGYLMWTQKDRIQQILFGAPLRHVSLLVLGMGGLYLGIGAVMGLHFLLLNKWFPFVVPLLLLLTAILSTHPRYVKTSVLVISACTLLGSGWHAIAGVKTYDYRQVIESIEASAYSQRPILIYPNYEKLPLEMVSEGKHDLLAVLEDVDFSGAWGIPPNHLEAGKDWSLPPEIDSDSVESFWLVSWLEESNLGVPFFQDHLYEKIDCQFLVMEEWEVAGTVQVQRWQRK
ncbi:MAG: hypothetical protein AAF399_02185 [Bacteroidota bacterium]